MEKRFIPVCEPTLLGNELAYITDAVKKGMISSFGDYTKKFETEFAQFCGVQHGVSCSSGTAALHLAVEALGIGRGDEVIIPSFTMIAAANAVIYNGARPVLVDSELGTWNMDPHQIEEKITARTKAILVVHTYGHPAAMDEILALAKKHNLKVIEDAAEAHGALYKGKTAGSLGDVAAFSFFANKIITTGEGGMVVTNDAAIAQLARDARNHYFGEPRFLHKRLGFNYRMTNLQAALGVAQLEHADQLIQMRITNAKKYNDRLQHIPGITLPPQKPWAKNVYWMYGILVDEKQFGVDVTTLRKKLLEKGIDTRSFFIGMHKQPYFKEQDPRFPDTSGLFPNAEILEQQGFYLPSSSHLSEEDISYIAETIKYIQEHPHKP